MDKREVAHLLRMMGDLVEIQGEQAFKVRAYEKAAQTIERGDYPLSRLAKEGRLLEIPNVGRNLEPKIRELLLTGKSSFLERLTEKTPLGLLDLLRVPGVGPRTARTLYTALGITGLEDLEAALASHRIQALPGVGEKREDAIAAGLILVKEYIGRVSIGVASPVADRFLETLASNGVFGVAVGNLRRCEETVKELEMLIKLGKEDTLQSLMMGSGIIHAADEKALEDAWDETRQAYVLNTGLGIPAVLYFEKDPFFWARVTWLTGPLKYVESLSEQAEEKGLRFGPHGLFSNGNVLPVADEQSLHRLLGVEWLPPQVRHREDLVKAAKSGRKVTFIDPSDIAGDLHLHTVWSDGTGTVEEMAEKAAALGYSYIAITDHATYMRMINGITPQKIPAYLQEIDRVQARYPNLRIYSGVEVDIHRDGSLFLSDGDLARFDVVVASIHQDTDPQDDLVCRFRRACKNPNVDIIGHPTCRKLGRRRGVQEGFQKLFETATKTGTVLEINCSPERLDLPEKLIREARDCGAAFAVSTDAHSPATMEGMRYGVVALARRAGLAPEAVVNTLSAPPWLSGKPS